MRIRKSYLVLSLTVIVFCLMISWIESAEVENSNTYTDNMIDTYNTLKILDYYYLMKEFNDFDINIWNKYNILVLITPGGIATLREPDGDMNKLGLNGEYQYLGETPRNVLVNNPLYPDTNIGTEVINTYNWQENTDENTKFYNLVDISEKQFYINEIFEFLEEEYGSRFDETVNPTEWLKRAIVILPSTEYGRGIIKFEHLWDKDGDGVAEAWYLTVNMRSLSEAIPKPMDFPVIGAEAIGVRDYDFDRLDVDENNDLRSGEKGAEEFDSEIAIPSGESLYASVRVSEYLHSTSYLKNTGFSDYLVRVSQSVTLRRWDDNAVMIDANSDGDYDDPGDSITGDWVYSGPFTISDAYNVNRRFEYYTIDSFELYGLDSVAITNDCLEDVTIQMETSVTPPTVAYDDNTSDNLKAPLNTAKNNLRLSSITIGDSNIFPSLPRANFSNEAERFVGEFQVRNDSLVVNGITYMDGSWTDTKGALPVLLPDAQLNPQGDLYLAGLTIPVDTQNGLHETTGNVRYTQIYPASGGGVMNHPLNNLEDVYVMTPVICYPELDIISRGTQLKVYDTSQKQLVIEESFHLNFPVNGQSIAAKGYGNRDYNEYIEVKQVQFPFDVYVGEDYDGLFLPKETWGNFNSLDNTFFVPSWVEEKGGHILFRTLAHNITDYEDPNYEYKFNSNPSSYKAVNIIAFNISGKINNFTVENCPDDYWTNQFSADEDVYLGLTPDNQTDLLDEGVTLNQNNILPLMPGKEYLTKDGEIKKFPGVQLGYPIEFSVTTNGDLSDANDYVYLNASYSFVPVIGGFVDMSLRQPVDLYVSSYEGVAAFDGDVLLTEKERTFVGDTLEKPASVDTNLKKSSVQQWNHKFFLPNMTYCVPSGTDLSSYRKLNLDKEPFLHDGYIIVNFDISVYDNLMGVTKELQTSTKKLNEFLATKREHIVYDIGWAKEGYELNQKGLRLEYGDVIFYSTDRRASETYY